MTVAKRRLSIYPGQVSLVLNIRHAEEFHSIFTANLPNIPHSHRHTVERFLRKVQSAISTGKRLNQKQSALDEKSHQ